MKILIVALYDDNYGDMLIRVCFRQLLTVVLSDIGMTNTEYEIIQMDLENQDADVIRLSDIIFFAGGGLFGLSYLGFMPYVEQILNIADDSNIPVVFSSLGINNMDATDEDETKLNNLLAHKCIKAMSVRENEALFRKYAPRDTYSIESVCDPVVWAQDIFGLDAKDNTIPIVGINAVRGGLFRSNGRDWTLADELSYIKNMSNILTENGLDYRVYTNGSFLDNNTLAQLTGEYEIPSDKIIKVHSSYELIETIASFSAVLAIRMHSSILSYAFGIPSLNLVWNDKIPLFYESIQKPRQAVELSEWTPEHVYHLLSGIIDKREAPNTSYKMTLYNYLYRTVSEVTHNNSGNPNTYEEVKLELKKLSIDNDSIDTMYYIRRAENSYSSLFNKDRGKSQRINILKEKLNNEKQNHSKTKAELKELKKINNKHIQTEEKLTKKVARRDAKLEKMQTELDELNRMFAVRAIKKIKRTLAK